MTYSITIADEDIASGHDPLNDFLTQAGYFNTNAGRYVLHRDPTTKRNEYVVTFDSSAWTGHEPRKINMALRTKLLEVYHEGMELLADPNVPGYHKVWMRQMQRALAFFAARV